MGKNKRKKKQKEADFKKVKLKVGKKLPKGTNETQTSFKSQGIVVPSQDLVKEGQLTNVKKQSLKDLISHLNHYSATVRKDAMVGLKSLFQQHISEFHDNLSLVLSSIADKMTDTDSDVRHSLQLLLQYILPQLPSDQASPFLPLLVAHLSSAMTHIYEDVQLESLGFLSLLLKLYPKQITASSQQLLDNFIGLISQHSGGSTSSKGSRGSTKIAVNPKGKLASPKARLKILSQLHEFLKSAYNRETVKAADLDFGFNGETPSTHHSPAKHTFMPVFDESAKEPKFQLFSFQSQVVGLKGANSTQEVCGDVKEFVHKIVPLLLEFWVECSPSQLSTSLPDNALSPVNISILSTIMNILKVLLHALFHNDDSNLERTEFVSYYFKDFNTYFMRFFPFQDSLPSKCKSKNPKVMDISTNTLVLNISVCEVMSFFVSIPLNIPRRSATVPWTGSIEEFVVDALELSSKNKLNAEQLSGLLTYVEKVIQQRVHQSDSPTRLLSCLYKLYRSSHLLSAIKILLLKFFAALFLKDDRLQVRSQAAVPWQALMNQWVHTLPKLLVQLKTASPENTSIVIKVLSTLLKQNPDAVDSNEIEKQLASFLDPVTGPFCKLTTQIQKSVVELVFNLAVVPDNLVHTLALCCHQASVSVAVVQYLMQVLNYRSPASCGLLDRMPAITLSSYLSFLFSISLGYSKKELNSLQSTNEVQVNVYNICLGKSGLEMINIWQRNQDILKAVCMMYSQLQNPQTLLNLMEPAIGKLLKENSTLPFTVAGSILKLYKCCLQLCCVPETTQNQSASFIESIAELSLSCILYSIKEDGTCQLDAEILQCLYNDVMDVLVAQPLVLEKFLCILLARATDDLHQTTVITTNLLQCLLRCTKPRLYSASVAELLHGLIEKIRGEESNVQQLSDLEYQYSLYVVELSRRNAEK